MGTVLGVDIPLPPEPPSYMIKAKDKVPDEWFEDEWWRAITEKWHGAKCRASHIDQCSWQYGGWDDEREVQWNERRSWMDKLIQSMRHAADSGLTLEQFLSYEGIDCG